MTELAYIIFNGAQAGSVLLAEAGFAAVGVIAVSVGGPFFVAEKKGRK